MPNDLSPSGEAPGIPETRLAVFHEPTRVTVARTFGTAIIAGAIAAFWAGGVRRWPVLALLMLWPSLGGHWVDVFFLNVVRPSLPTGPLIQRGARLVIWFAAGIVLAFGARLTAALLFTHLSLEWLTWARAGLGFVAIELVAHAALYRRGRASFYDGRG